MEGLDRGTDKKMERETKVRRDKCIGNRHMDKQRTLKYTQKEEIV